MSTNKLLLSILAKAFYISSRDIFGWMNYGSFQIVLFRMHYKWFIESYIFPFLALFEFFLVALSYQSYLCSM